MSKKAKRFLDTSVARPIMHGSSLYRKYFEQAFIDSELYTSQYVRMEYKRSFIVKVIDFYSVLGMHSTRTIGDAFNIWSDKFRGSDLKAIIQLTTELFSGNRLDTTDPLDKPKALTVLGALIKRFDYKLWMYKDAGINSHKCARSTITIYSNGNVKEDLKKFVDLFNDTNRCRSRCSIHKFILSRHKAEVDRYIKSATQLPTNRETKGFINIANNLQRIVSEGGQICSCKMCEKIGDFVITLDSPGTMSLEHTDLSFNRLCDLIGKKHQQHPSQAWVVKNASAISQNTEE